VFLGSYLVSMYCNDMREMFELAVDIAEMGEIHPDATIARLRLQLTNFSN